MPKKTFIGDTVKTSLSQEATLIKGTGEMASRIREKDWNNTILGSIATWPQSLITTVNLILNSKFPMYIFWGKENVCFYNDTYRPSLGAEGMHPEMLGMPAKEAWGDVYETFIKSEIKGIKENGNPTWYEDLLVPIFRNGTMEDVYWTFSYIPIYDEASKIEGILVTVMETTEKVLSHRTLEESNSQLNFAIEAGNLATFSYDPLTDTLRGNNRFKEWFGLKDFKDINLKEEIYQAIEFTDRKRVAIAMSKALNFESGGDYNIVYSIINNENNEKRVVHALGKSYFDENNNAFRFNGIIHDITVNYTHDQKLRDTFFKLKESEEELQFAIDAAELGTWDYNPKTNKFRGNERLKNWFGLSKADEIDLEKGIEVIVEEDKLRVQTAIANALNFETDHHYNIVYSIKSPKDKNPRVIRAIGKAWFDDTDEPNRFNGILQDITEQYTSEKKLKEAFFKVEESEKRFRRMANNAPVFIIITDVDGKITFANQLWLDFIGSTLKKHLGTIGFENTHPEDIDDCRAIFVEAYKHQKEFKMEYRVKRFDGRYRWMVNKGVPRYNVDGDFEGYIHAFMNIHDIKLQEKQKDLFIGMASHELKTPVTSVKGYVQLLSAKYKDSDDVFLKNALQTIDKQILVLTSLITDLLNLSKMKRGGLQLKKSSFEVNTWLENIVAQLSVVTPEHTISVDSGVSTEIFADEERLGQVINNFLTNAVKYAPDSKKIEVTSRIENDVVYVSVKDYGIGIKEENRERIFKRFYREEGRDENTFPGFGIGLYIAADIIKKHKGTIGVDSEKGKGSTFYFTVPIK